MSVIQYDKPQFLHERKNATQYGLRQSRLSYQFRMPYTWECIEKIYQEIDQVSEIPSRVLDVGCGMGDVAIPMAMKYPVDAVDVSMNMLSLAKLRPGGNQSNLRWLHSAVEDAELEGPYTAITAGDAIHWLDWPIVFPRFKQLLHPQGKLFLLCRYYDNLPWMEDLQALETRYHTVKNFERYDTLDLLSKNKYWQQEGFHKTQVEALSYTIEDYIEAMHSRNGFTRDLMTLADQDAFDKGLHDIVKPYLHADERLHVGTYSTVTWGRLSHL